MPDWLDYKGIEVPSATPSGVAGLRLKQNLQSLVDWSPKSNWAATSDPTVDDDDTADYFPGSLWLNTTTSALYLCVNNSSGVAQWISLAGGSGSGELGIVSVDDDYPAQPGDLVVADLSTKSIEISLPAVTDNARIGIKLGTASGTRTVTITPDGTDEIDGQTSILLYMQSDYLEIQGNAADGQWLVVRDGIQAHMAEMTRNTAQSVGSTLVKVNLNNATYDTAGIADPTTNNRFNIRRSGKYVVNANITFPAIPNAGYVSTVIYVNGTIVRWSIFHCPTTSYTVRAFGSFVLSLSAGDYVEMYTQQDNGMGNQNTSTTTNDIPRMSLVEQRSGG